jgi:hypothetical protein
MVVKCKNGVEIKFEEGLYFYMVTVGDKTWYWSKETSKFDGVSFPLKD